MHELHLTNNNMFYTLIVSTNRYLDHFSNIRRKKCGEKIEYSIMAGYKKALIRECNLHNILFVIRFVMLLSDAL